MSFDQKTQRALRRAGSAHIDPNGGPAEAWRAMEEANRLFGADGWSREVLEMRCAATREREGVVTTAYVAKVRVSLGSAPFRDGHGCGEGRGDTPFEAHNKGLKAAELDATLRALATFGKPFGLGVLGHRGQEKRSAGRSRKAEGSAEHATGQAGQDTDREGDDPPGENQSDPEPAESEAKPNRSGQANETGTVWAKDIVRADDEGGAFFLPKQRRLRAPAHLAHVRSQPCLVCGRSPADAHHLRFMQPRAMAKKVSDEFTVPLCRRHHDLVHRDPDEPGWWAAHGIDPVLIAQELWDESTGTVPV
ncbi:DUF968 domain-containing protein [Marinicauda algicola]|uniref:DUF968 domain-containing protein n=1 Tax=Marinicauda algicola TaxID=2029849 RepID=A0A4S2H407_9PROT|nr:Rad52/Rad22 family DNA repair protein [Marinicauda algicola]TGY90326.1 DUF968 domain-containing protein [Marinicauda algicola]